MFARFFLTMGVVAVGITIVLMSDLAPQVNTAGQQQDRMLKDRVWQNEPIKVIAVTGKGGRTIALGRIYLAGDDWLRDLGVSIKNISKKNILFVELELHFLRPKSSPDETITAFPIVFGTPPALIDKSAPVLAPNETWQVSLSDQDYASIRELLANTNYPTSIKEVEIVTREVVFGDQTKWSAGRMQNSSEEGPLQVPLDRSKKKLMGPSFSRSV
jgi:hypothetical protein